MNIKMLMLFKWDSLAGRLGRWGVVVVGGGIPPDNSVC